VVSQLADFAALKAVSELRQSLPRGSPEWLRAHREEDGLIARVLAWVGQRPGDSRQWQPSRRPVHERAGCLAVRGIWGREGAARPPRRWPANLAAAPSLIDGA